MDARVAGAFEFGVGGQQTVRIFMLIHLYHGCRFGNLIWCYFAALAPAFFIRMEYSLILAVMNKVR